MRTFVTVALCLASGLSYAGDRIFPPIFSPDNAWNRDISREAVDPNSDILIKSIGLQKGLHPDFGTTYNGVPNGIPYMMVSGTQAKVPVEFRYKDESDAGPYPVPMNAPIEGDPAATGDRHVLVVDVDHGMLYEMWDAHPLVDGKGWKAGSGAIFDLKSNKSRPAGWTSADAAGLPVFPGLVRYDEVVEQKTIAHALRFTCVRSRHAYVPPATHFASPLTDVNLPPMGMRVRLKAGYDISGFPQAAQVILIALKRYGMFLADNGADWFLSGAPDPRWNDEELNSLKRVKGSDFEVVKMPAPVTR